VFSHTETLNDLDCIFSVSGAPPTSCEEDNHRHYDRNILGGHQLIPFVVEDLTGVLGTKTVYLIKILVEEMQRAKHKPYSQRAEVIHDRIACHVRQALDNKRHFLVT
jgi:hypothetical protein